MATPMTPYYPARDGHPSMFAPEDNVGAVSGEPMMSGSVDYATDATARALHDAHIGTTHRKAVAPLAGAASSPSVAGRTRLSPEHRRILQMLDYAGSRGCREGL